MNYCKYLILIFLFVCNLQAKASHIVGGEVTYKFTGVVAGGNRYEISLVIYQDCLNGQIGAIDMDNPAYLSVFDTGTSTGIRRIYLDTTINFSEKLVVPVNFSNACVTNIPPVCLLKKTFKRSFVLPPNSAGYIVSYQRCCRNAQVMNIRNPGDEGATYFCYIPPVGLVASNNSAVFKQYPPQIICRNNPLYYDHSATDADGDSLSYEFCNASIGATASDIKPIPGPPPYPNVQYIAPPYSAIYPLTAFPLLQIDPRTGIISGTPNRVGRFLVTVCCSEWRGGVLINVMKREFQFVVTDCSKVVVACIPQFSTDINTFIVECTSFTVQFVNCSSGGFSYHWDFGVPGIDNDTSNELAPIFTYPDTGIFTVKLVVNPGSTCPDSISRFVKIFPTFTTNFTDSGTYCPGKPITFTDKSATTIKPITSWIWNFGDGGTSGDQNPVHSYSYGGTYNVLLISQNVKNCIDTSVRQVIIENFRPSAGNDTIIVKGESILFNATGGNQYTWSPPDYLNNININNPLGIYPDTGIINYIVNVTSAYGCMGSDTIKVWVVSQAAFFVPTGFSPNGDGNNDVFRPIAIGYRSLKYFRVYNRWGEQVYYGENISEGWDGSQKGKPAELGTYFWQISFVDRFGKEGYMKGDVTLVR
ncbi:MAG: gliding motility-associated C-terminal domain-containing protein [Taibaiella sp.]|nr:gliding motility-associated C-terminal domain-containing protein [Taibaiella sp.]